MTAATIVAIPDLCELRQAEDGTFEVELLNPLSLIELRDTEIGKELLRLQDWYSRLPWAQTRVPVGRYAVRLLIPGSNDRTTKEQCALLLPDEKPIPVTLAATVLLCLRKAGHPDPLHNNWLRCAEESDLERRIVLNWFVGFLRVQNHWDYHRSDRVWAAGARRLS